MLNQPELPEVQVADGRVDDHAGRYALPASSLVVEVGDDGAPRLLINEEDYPGQVSPTLSMPLPSDVAMTYVADDVGRVGPTLVPFLRRPDESVGWLSFGLRLYPKDGARLARHS